MFVLLHANFTGGVRTVATYARLLSRRGHRVTVVSTPLRRVPLVRRLKSLALGSGWPPAQSPEPSYLDGSGVEHLRLRDAGPVTDRDVPDADVVVATWWETAEWVAALSPRKGAKAYFIQGDEADIPGQPAERVAATWRLPMHRIVCSRWLAELGRTKYRDGNATCAPNGVDLYQFAVPPRDRQVRPTVGFVYSEAKGKGCDLAVGALEELARRLRRLRVLAFGHLAPAAALPLPGWVDYRVKPAQHEIPQLYASCDVWLWPSRREGFGLPILEAMACRTPVIAAPSGAAPDLLREGGGVLLARCDAREMAIAAERVLSMDDRGWRAMSDRARAVAERHDWERCTDTFEAALAATRRGG